MLNNLLISNNFSKKKNKDKNIKSNKYDNKCKVFSEN